MTGRNLFADDLTDAAATDATVGRNLFEEEAMPWPEDVARSMVTGVREAAEDFVATPGNVRDISTVVGEALARKAADVSGVPQDDMSERLRRYKAILDNLRLAGPAGVVWRHRDKLPGSKDVREFTSGIVGEHYQPETTAGRYARAGARGAAGAAAPGSIFRRALMAVAPGIVGEATADTAALFNVGETGQEVARFLGNVGGGTLAARGYADPTMTLARRAAKTAPSRRQLADRISDLYDTMDDAGIIYDPSDWGDFIKKMTKRLYESGFNPETDPKLFAQLRAFADVGDMTAGQSPATFRLVENFRQNVGRTIRQAEPSFRGPGDPNLQRGMRILRSGIDDFTENSKMVSLKPMDGKKLSATQKLARSLAMRQKKADRLDAAMEYGEVYEAGGDRGARKAVRNLLKRKEGASLFRPGTPEFDVVSDVSGGRRNLQRLEKFGVPNPFDNATGGSIHPYSAAPGTLLGYGLYTGDPLLIGAGTAMGGAGTAARWVGPGMTRRAADTAAAALRSGALNAPDTAANIDAMALERALRTWMAAQQATAEGGRSIGGYQ